VLEEFFEATLELFDQIEESAKNVADKGLDIAGIRKFMQKGLPDVAGVEKEFALANKLRSLGSEQTHVFSGLQEKLGKGMVKTVVPAWASATYETGVGLVKGISKDTSPSRAVRKIYFAQKVLDQVDEKITKFSNKFVKGAEFSTVDVTRKDKIVKFATSLQSSILPKTIEGIDNTVESIIRMNENPQIATETLEKNLSETFDSMPQISSRIQALALGDLRFLANKVPRNPFTNEQIQAGGIEYQVSDEEIAKINRYFQALNNPLSVVEDLASGRLNFEGIEALKARRPKIYTYILEKLANALALNVKPISYPKRLLLSQFLGIPIEPTSMPGFSLEMQSHFAPTLPPTQAAPKPTSRKSTKKVKYPSQVASPTGRVDQSLSSPY